MIDRVRKCLVPRKGIDKKNSPVAMQGPSDPDGQRDADHDIDGVRVNRVHDLAPLEEKFRWPERVRVAGFPEVPTARPSPSLESVV